MRMTGAGIGSTKNPSAAPPSGDGTEPTPSGSIIVDMRAGGAHDLQAANNLADAQAIFSSAIGAGSHWTNDANGTAQFTNNYNGSNKRALRIDWAATAGESLVDAIIYFTGSTAQLCTTAVIHYGKTATGGGNGSIGSFVPSTAGGGMKPMLWLRARDDGTNRIYWTHLAGDGATSSNAMSIDDTGFDSLFTANYGVGVDVTWTFRLTPGSPGSLEAWRDGTRVLNNTSATIGTTGFAEFQLYGARHNTTQAESLYITDLAIWRP